MAITITQTDIENVFGTADVALWLSSGTNVVNPTANATRSAQAVALGIAYVNNRLESGPYTIPLTALDPSNPPADIIDAMASYAGWWAWKTKGINFAKYPIQRMDGIKRDIDNLLRRVKSNVDYVACVPNTERRQTPFSVG